MDGAAAGTIIDETVMRIVVVEGISVLLKVRERRQGNVGGGGEATMAG